ncbi:hypothetical protein EXIGLDRAFT_600972, partial [Exidia glandulosa HHB12029]
MDEWTDGFTKWLSTPEGVKALTAVGLEPTFLEHIDAAEVLAAALNAQTIEPTATVDRVFNVIPKRQPPAGRSSVGVSVLTAGGHLGSREEKPLPLRLDSGANISLVARSFLESMKNPPKIHTGLKVAIAQLTNKNPRIEGYVNMPVWIRSTEGTWLRLHAELYVVPEMTVEVLLGEDWHVNNELSVLRSLEKGTRVVVGNTGFTFDAISTQHRRDKANRHRRKRVYANGAIRAWEDVIIPAESSRTIPIAGDLQQNREWYVERALVPQHDGTFLTVPNTLLSLRTEDAGCAEPGSIARRSQVSISNPTKVPRVVRAGTLLGYAKDPATFLDKPRTQEEL